MTHGLPPATSPRGRTEPFTSPTGAINARPIPIRTPIGTAVNGRIYRIRPADRPINSVRSETEFGDAKHEPSRETLISSLLHGDGWHSRRALRLLAEERDARAGEALRPHLVAGGDANNSLVALRSLWGIYASGTFDESLALPLLDHPAEAVRAWTVRFLGDQHNVSERIEHGLRRLAESERSPVVLARAGLFGQASAGGVLPEDRPPDRRESGERE